MLCALNGCGKKPSFVDPPVRADSAPKPVFEETQPPATAKAPSTTAQLPTNPHGNRVQGRGPDKGGFPHPYPKPWL